VQFSPTLFRPAGLRLRFLNRVELARYGPGYGYLRHKVLWLPGWLGMGQFYLVQLVMLTGFGSHTVSLLATLKRNSTGLLVNNMVHINEVYPECVLIYSQVGWATITGWVCKQRGLNLIRC